MITNKKTSISDRLFGKKPCYCVNKEGETTYIGFQKNCKKLCKGLTPKGRE